MRVQDVKYNVRLLPCIERQREPVQTIVDTDAALLIKKQDMQKFQEEFMVTKRASVYS